MGHEVLQDHLLQMAVLGVHLGQRLERGHALVLALADAHEDAAGEGDAQLTGRSDGLEAPGRVLGGRALVHDEVRVDALEHQPLRGRDLAQAGQVVAGEHAEVRVRQQAALQRPLARPRHVGGEVLVAPGLQALADLGVDLGVLAGQHQQLLDRAAGRPVEQREHLVGLVQVRLVGGEGAVLAIAPAGPREREREVAREGDAPARHSRAVYGGRVETPVCDVSPPGACATGGSRSWAGSGSWSSARWPRGPPGRRSRATSTCPARTPSARSTCSSPLPGAVRRQRHDRLPHHAGHGDRAGGAGAHAGDVRPRREAAARTRRGLALRAGAGRRRARSRPTGAPPSRTVQFDRRAINLPKAAVLRVIDAARGAGGERDPGRARRPGDPERPAHRPPGRQRGRSGCWRRSSSCC